MFRIHPEPRERFMPTLENRKFCYTGKEFICFGAGEGAGSAALYLNSTLQEGQSNPCPTFNNPNLLSTEDTFFKVSVMEVILF